jgi:acyl carrier protein
LATVQMTRFSLSSTSWRLNPMPDVEKVVRDTVQEMLPGEDDKIRPDTALRDLFLDSLDMLEFKMRLEEKLNVGLEIDVFESSATLREFTHRVATSL